MLPEPITHYDRHSVAARNAERERSESFLAMSPEAQAEMRARWDAELERQILREARVAGRCIQDVIYGTVLFLVVTIVWDVPTLLTVPAAAVFGATTGIAWNRLGVGRFGALTVAMPMYVLLRFISPAQGAFQMFFGLAAMAGFAAMCGMMREMEVGDLDPARFTRWRKRS